MNDAPLILHLVVIGLAAARLAVLLVHDTILDAPRDWLHRHHPPVDNPMLGYDYQQRDADGQRMPEGTIRDASMLGEVFTCTRCMTVWTTALVGAVYVSGVPYVQDATALLAAMWLAAWGAKKV